MHLAPACVCLASELRSHTLVAGHDQCGIELEAAPCWGRKAISSLSEPYMLLKTPKLWEPLNLTTIV